MLGALVLLSFVVLVLLQTSNLWKDFTVETASDTLLLYALSSLNFFAFVIFGFIFLRSILKLLRERRALQLGARIKTRLLVFFAAVSLMIEILKFSGTLTLQARGAGAVPYADARLEAALPVAEVHVEDAHDGACTPAHDHQTCARTGQLGTVARVGEERELRRAGTGERADAVDQAGRVAAQGQAEALGEFPRGHLDIVARHRPGGG